jgi:hypothetical protein
VCLSSDWSWGRSHALRPADLTRLS